MPKERYMCQLCANHGLYDQPKKGHKRRCPHANCTCQLCSLNTRRRVLDQAERRLRADETSLKLSDAKAHLISPTQSSITSMPVHRVNAKSGIIESKKPSAFNCCDLSDGAVREKVVRKTTEARPLARIDYEIIQDGEYKFRGRFTRRCVPSVFHSIDHLLSS